MASGNLLLPLPSCAQLTTAMKWIYGVFTSGSTEPSLGDTIWGDNSNANAVLEYLVLTSGSWGGNDAAGYMILSNHNGTAWSSGENFTANTTTPANHGTFVGIPSAGNALRGSRNDDPVLNFDDTINRVAVFPLTMPNHYDLNGLIVTLSISTATITGDMSFAAFLKSITDDTDNAHEVGVDPSGLKVFAAPQVNQAMDAPAGVGRIKDYEIPFTDGAQMDSIAAGERFYLLVMRDAQDGTNDDMVGDASLTAIKIEEA